RIRTKNFDGTPRPNVKVSVESTAASTENIRLIAGKKAQFAIAMPDGVYFGYHGGREFKDKKYPNLRAVLGGHSSPMHFLVKSNSGIKSFADLKGKRVALSAPGSTAMFMAESTLEAYGLTKQDYKQLLMSYKEQIDALRDGAIDMACIFAGAPVSSVMDLCTTHEITFFDVGPEEMKKILKVHPYCKEYVIKAGTYRGQNREIKTFATLSILITYAELEEALVYAVSKAILEHTAELKEVHPQAGEYNVTNTGMGMPIPLHPGAARYLQEKGILKE
ncbi:MAG: TAXI family TRAP transporter solute-binding subunit, partial [candidate division WOR-3 bacterium]